MKTNKHGLKRTPRRTASVTPSFVLLEPKLSMTEKESVERAWKLEIRRRIADLDAGKLKCVPAKQALRNAYRALDCVKRKRESTTS
jgi:hypothetical protein